MISFKKEPYKSWQIQIRCSMTCQTIYPNAPFCNYAIEQVIKIYQHVSLLFFALVIIFPFSSSDIPSWIIMSKEEVALYMFSYIFHFCNILI